MGACVRHFCTHHQRLTLCVPHRTPYPHDYVCQLFREARERHERAERAAALASGIPKKPKKAAQRRRPIKFNDGLNLEPVALTLPYGAPPKGPLKQVTLNSMFPAPPGDDSASVVDD